MRSSQNDLVRCPWCGTDPTYQAYHDTEWGVPERDDQALFGKLILDGFQAGLSWLIILRKRAAITQALADFDAERLARFSAARIERLMQDPAIVRNRAKLQAAVTNARAYLAVREERSSFADHLWGFVDGAPLQHRFARLSQIPTESRESQAMAKDLRKRGFAFCGPTICYAFMQAVGMVNDHLTSCFRYSQVSRVRRSPARAASAR